jgi:hypothetical protein
MPESHEVPQFQTAEFSSERPVEDVCALCRQPVSGTYYRIRGAMACPACTQQVLLRKPEDTHAAFVRAVLFGCGAALVGLILYSAVGILFHLEIGFISLAVGYMVGKAMMKGSGEIGGRRYQWVAVVLTYAAVTVSAVPVGIAQYMASHKRTQQVRQGPALQKHSTTAPATAQGEARDQAAPADSGAAANADDSSRTGATAPSNASPSAPSAAPAPAKTINAGRLLRILILLLGYGLASPVLGVMSSPLSGLIGLVILFVGVRIAWQIAAGRRLPQIEGPY